LLETYLKQKETARRPSYYHFTTSQAYSRTLTVPEVQRDVDETKESWRPLALETFAASTGDFASNCKFQMLAIKAEGEVGNITKPYRQESPKS
jgi:hypothetical protein